MTEQTCLQLDNLSVNFGGVFAVRDLSLHVACGERHAILGPNGAGKTTLFNLVAGDIKPVSGRIQLQAKDITSATAHQRARLGVARTYQRSLLFPSQTIRQHLYLALRGTQPHRLSFRSSTRDTTSNARVEAVADLVDLSDDLDTIVATLSHGRQRQLDIGMAIAPEPALLLLDEPAAGLSPGDREQLADLLESLPRTITMMIIEHDMDVALRIADFITVMAEGSKIASGTPDHIRHDPIVQAVYLGSDRLSTDDMSTDDMSTDHGGAAT
jgi:branched-chain amino acid transport system ATP-binding protein